MKSWWLSLDIGKKLNIPIQGVLVVVLSFAHFWVMEHIKDEFLDGAKRRAAVSADGIINGMNMLMVTDSISNLENRRLFIKKMSESEDVKELRIIRAKQVQDQFGVGLPEEQVKDDVDRRAIASKQIQFVLNEDRSNPTLRTVVPFIATNNFRGTNCLGCHQVVEGSVNGAASITIDMTDDYNAISRTQFFLIAGQILLQILLFLSIGWLIRRFLQPIKKLRSMMHGMQLTGDSGTSPASKPESNSSARSHVLKSDDTHHAEAAERDEISALTASFIEMTQRLDIAQDQLVQDKSRLQGILESSMDAVVQMNAEGMITGWTKRAELIFGWSGEEVIGRVLHEVIVPQQYRDAHERGLRRFLQSGEGHVLNTRIEISGLHRDGYEFPIELSITHRKLGDVYEFSAFIRDISERKKTSDELRIAATAFDSNESMMITNADNIILRVNHAFTETTGYTAEELVGKTPRLLKSGRHDEDFYRAMWASINATGTWQGEIWDRRKNGELYPKWLCITAVKGLDGSVTHYVGSHIDITDRKTAEAEVERLAFYDPLTHLPNRRLLMDRLHQTLLCSTRSGREGALLFIDLDNFKTINDSLGHHAGDLLLQGAGARLTACLREGDTVARLGGDEFVVMLNDLSEHPIEAAEQTELIGEKILAALSQPYPILGQKCYSTPSIGVTLFGDKPTMPENLLKQADIAMYQAKKAGRNTLRFFDPKMQDMISIRAALEVDLRNALENQQFRLHYQIQVNSDQQPLGAEALIRWIHPERGLVSPAQFIPLAEETGLIVPIGKWAFEVACAQIKKWEQYSYTQDLVLAVNVSAKQFNQPDFVEQVKAVVQRHGINPTRLKLELTESMLVENIESIIASMSELKELGIQFSLDDFGTGYSSLQYLQKLPLDQIKIDQSFVRELGLDINENSIVRTIIAMATGLNLDVIAEGVETTHQQTLLQHYGCEHFQGYLFSRPVPIEQFEVQLNQS